MQFKTLSLDHFRHFAGLAKPLLRVSIVAPVVVIALGVLLHAGFSVTASTSEVVFGGPVEATTLPASAALPELVAANPIAGSPDGLAIEEENPPILEPMDSIAAGNLFSGQGASYPNDARIHVVRPGDTLFSIASQYGVSQQELARANQAAGQTLIVGDELVIPSTAAPAASESRASSHLTFDTYLPAGFQWPVPNHTNPRHGPRHDRFNAYDLPDAAGTSVSAAGDGTVVDASYGWNGGYGNRVILEHPQVADGSVDTLYGHLQDILVVVGQQVTKGQVIGLMGSTGHSTGPHVHFEVRW